jgi:hypothetical protein
VVNVDVVISLVQKSDSRPRATPRRMIVVTRDRSRDRRSLSPDRGRLRRAQSRSRSRSRSLPPLYRSRSPPLSSASKGKRELEDATASSEDKKTKLTDEQKRARLEKNKVASTGVFESATCTSMYLSLCEIVVFELTSFTHQALTPKN